jgi:hypothetical protein
VEEDRGFQLFGFRVFHECSGLLLPSGPSGRLRGPTLAARSRGPSLPSLDSRPQPCSDGGGCRPAAPRRKRNK